VSFTLRLTEDRLSGGARVVLPPRPRVLYTRDGATRIEGRPPAVQAAHIAPATTSATRIEGRPPTQAELAAPATINELKPGSAWHGVGDVVLVADALAMVLRFELVGSDTRDGRDAESFESRPLLEHPIDLDPARPWLMRCDRVDFAPGGVALPQDTRVAASAACSPARSRSPSPIGRRGS